MRVRFRVQQHLAIFYRDGDSGDWWATCCRRGLEELLGRRLKPNDELCMDITAVEVNERTKDEVD